MPLKINKKVKRSEDIVFTVDNIVLFVVTFLALYTLQVAIVAMLATNKSEGIQKKSIFIVCLIPGGFLLWMLVGLWNFTIKKLPEIYRGLD
jgi:hypothetical protein